MSASVDELCRDAFRAGALAMREKAADICNEISGSTKVQECMYAIRKAELPMMPADKVEHGPKIIWETEA